jgi:hypothetical protein
LRKETYFPTRSSCSAVIAPKRPRATVSPEIPRLSQNSTSRLLGRHTASILVKTASASSGSGGGWGLLTFPGALAPGSFSRPRISYPLVRTSLNLRAVSSCSKWAMSVSASPERGTGHPAFQQPPTPSRPSVASNFSLPHSGHRQTARRPRTLLGGPR